MDGFLSAFDANGASGCSAAPRSARHSGSRIRGRRSPRRRWQTGSSTSARPSAAGPTGSDSPPSMPRPATCSGRRPRRAASPRRPPWLTAPFTLKARTGRCSRSTPTASRYGARPAVAPAGVRHPPWLAGSSSSRAERHRGGFAAVGRCRLLGQSHGLHAALGRAARDGQLHGFLPGGGRWRRLHRLGARAALRVRPSEHRPDPAEHRGHAGQPLDRRRADQQFSATGTYSDATHRGPDRHRSPGPRPRRPSPRSARRPRPRRRRRHEQHQRDARRASAAARPSTVARPDPPEHRRHPGQPSIAAGDRPAVQRDRAPTPTPAPPT